MHQVYGSKELTPREIEILYRIARGLSNKQIALEFGTTEQTIKNQNTTMYKKLNVYNRLQALVAGIRLLVIVPGRIDNAKANQETETKSSQGANQAGAAGGSQGP